MKILVPVKKVPDYQTKVKVKADGSGIETDNIKWIVNPFDEIAVEEALRIKEAGKATQVEVLGIGPDDCQTQLRYAMAMGADTAIHVKTDSFVDSEVASRVLAEVYKRGSYGLIIMGKQGIDSDAGQTPQLLAARLNLQQACFASKVVIEGDKAVITREVDGGLETIRISIPAIISTDLRLNEPRYAPLPGIMKAKKKPLEVIEIGSLGISTEPVVKVLKMTPPQSRKSGKKVSSVQELVKLLKEDAKVI